MVDPNIKKKANDIRNKIKGKEVCESLASGLEEISEDVVQTKGRQDDVEDQFQDVIENTTGKDVISAPEIIAARNGKPNLKRRIDDLEGETASQWAQKADRNAVRFSTVPIGINDINGDLLAELQKTEETTFNLLSIPRTESVSVDKTTFIRFGKNLFDADAVLSERRVQWNGDITPLEGYVVSDFILLKGGLSYVANNARHYGLYTLDKTYIDQSFYDNPFDNSDNLKDVTITPSQDCYVRFTIRNDLVSTFQLELGTTASEYEPYRLYFPKLKVAAGDIEGLPSHAFGSLTGKTMLNLGASIANGAPYGDEYISYAHLIANRNNMTIFSKATGGASMANTDDNNNIHDQIDAAIQEGITADYILINGLTNDIATSRNVPLGSITTGYNKQLVLTTFCGSLESAFKKLRLNWLRGKIIYTRPHHMISRDIQHLTYTWIA